MNTLSSEQVSGILRFLDVQNAQPTISTLQTLIAGYVLRVPWESVSRIVRKAHTCQLTERPRWPAEFWQLATLQGTGGTCFESNYAFWKLLEALGFRGYLTINDMGETCGCHSPIVVEFEAENDDAVQRYVVDVGLPLYTAIPLDRQQTTSAASEHQSYSIQPIEGNGMVQRYLIERAPHTRPTAYTLIDKAVSEEDYIQAVIHDYDKGGLFLDTVVITKLVNGVLSRFSSHERPYVLEFFVNGERSTQAVSIDHKQAGAEIGSYFGIPSTLVSDALTAVSQLESD